MKKDFSIHNHYYQQRLTQVSFDNGTEKRTITFHYTKQEYIEPEVTDTKLATDVLKKFML